MKSILRWEDRVLDLINAFLVSTMVAAIFLQVLARYVFNYPLSWPEELGRFLFSWVVFLGIVSVLRNDELLGVDLLYRWIPQTVGRGLRLIVYTTLLVFLVIMLKGGIELMLRQSSQISVALEVSMSIVYFVIPFGTFLMIVEMVIKIIHQAGDLFRSGRKHASGTAS